MSESFTLAQVPDDDVQFDPYKRIEESEEKRMNAD